MKPYCYLELVDESERIETAAFISHLNGTSLSDFPSLTQNEIEEAKKLITDQVEKQKLKYTKGV